MKMQQFLKSPIHKKRHNPTISIVSGKLPMFIPTELVIMTEKVKFIKNPWSFPDIPICVVECENKFYIIDGNHRFAADKRRGLNTINAWVLTSIDRDSVKGHEKGELPAELNSWKKGVISFLKLKERAVQAAEGINQHE